MLHAQELNFGFKITMMYFDLLHTSWKQSAMLFALDSFEPTDLDTSSHLNQWLDEVWCDVRVHYTKKSSGILNLPLANVRVSLCFSRKPFSSFKEFLLFLTGYLGCQAYHYRFGRSGLRFPAGSHRTQCRLQLATAATFCRSCVAWR